MPQVLPIIGKYALYTLSPGYIKKKPHTKYMTHAIEYRPIFLVTISDTFLDLTKPASNIVNPAAIHITKAPEINK